VSPALSSTKFVSLSALKPSGSKPIDVKLAKLGGVSVVGTALSSPQMFEDGVSYLQEFANSTVFYNPSYGAVSINAAIYGKWKEPALSIFKVASGASLRDYLGFPIADAFSTEEQGGSAAYFERGMIVVRANKQAYVVSGPIYEHYRRLGDISDPQNGPVIGLPNADEQIGVNGGRFSTFDSGDIYWTLATGARELHGAIRQRWLDMGGASSVLGYPTSDECSVMNGKTEIGRFNRFANGGFIYWSPATGAWDVYGAIYTEWNSKGGPLGALGFPVSGETSTIYLPGFVQGRFNDFQNGVIAWYPSGDYMGAHTVLGVQLYLERYECNDDFNVQINIEATPANPPNINHGRMPSGGEYDGGGKELDTVLLTVPLVHSDTQVNVWMLCIHEKTIGTDDEEGTVTENYSILNLWGLLEDNHAHQNGAFTATYEMKPFPLPPVSLDPEQFRTQLFWPFQNFDTDTLSWKTYSDTFSDVAETDKHIDLNPFDFKLHLFEIAFYSIVYEGLGGPGNCFGLCVESTYARENRSLFIEPIFSQNSYESGTLTAIDGKPLAETTSQSPSARDAEVVNEANIKHGYQVGANFIEWFLGKWITGGLHQPIDAFNDSKQYFEANDWPVLSISGDGDLSQSAHVLVPYKWSPPQGGPMTMWVANINDPPPTTNDDPHNLITIDPVDDSFRFQMHDGQDGIWSGSPTTGGRILAIPHSQLNTEPVTPGDAILALIVAGVVIICGGDGSSNQITDEHGHQFYLYPIPPVSTGGVVLKEPVAQASNSLSSRRINIDPQNCIPEMARIPTHGSTPGYFPPSLNQVGTVNRNSVDALPPESARAPELYYLHRAGQPMKMQAVQPGAIGQSRGGNLETTVVSQDVQPLMEANSLTFELTANANGSYNWAVLCPGMSASISAQSVEGMADIVHVDALNTHNQAITFNAPAGGPGRAISLAVGGFSGGDPAERRWYELLNIGIAAGQSISAQVNDRGGELMLRNSGPAISFELRVHYGMEAAAMAIRPAVYLDADKSFHIAPEEWNKATIVNAALNLTVFDSMSGAQLTSRAV